MHPMNSLVLHGAKRRRALTVLLAFPLLLALTASEGLSLEVEYVASDAAASPQSQGWSTFEITASGTDGDEDGLVDGATNNGPLDLGGGAFAWQTRDRLAGASQDLPHYFRTLSAADIDELYEYGWTFTAEIKAPEAGSTGLSGFWGWGFANGLGGWNVSGGAARVGFSPGVANPEAPLESQRFKLQVYGGGEIHLSPGTVDAYHVVKAVGRPRSTSYDLYIDGQHVGYFDAADSALAGQTANQVVFGARSSPLVNETINWKSVSLTSGAPPIVSERSAKLIGEFDTHLDSVMGIGIDTATGSFTRAVDLLTVSGLREFSFTANYDSQLDFRPGPLGLGWSHNYEARIHTVDADHVDVRWDANRSSRFTRDPSYDSSNTRWYFSDDKALEGMSVYQFPLGYVLSFRDESNMGFGVDGDLEQIADALDQVLEISRNAAGRVSQIREPVTDLSIFLEYDKRGLVQNVSDSTGRVVRLAYDNEWRLMRMPVAIDLVDLEEASSAGAQPIPAASTGQSLQVEIYAGNFEGALGTVRVETLYIEHVDPDNVTLELQSPQGTKIDITNRATAFPGALTMVEADFDNFMGEQGRGAWKLVVTAVNGAPAGSFGNMTLSRFENDRAIAYEYEPSGETVTSRIVRATDSLGHQLYLNEYDSLGRVVRQEDGRADSPAVTVAYSEPDVEGAVTSTFTSSMGFQTALTHDARFRLQSVVDPLGHTTTRTFDVSGNLVRRTDGRGFSTEFEYDDAGRVILYRNELGDETKFGYEGPSFKIAEIEDPLGNVSKFTYFASTGGLRIATQNDEEVVNALYLSNRQLRTVVFNGYSKTEYYLDGNGRTGVVGYPEDKTTARLVTPSGSSREYDGAGRLVETSDYDGRSTVTEYTGAGEVVRTTDPDGNEEVYEHDYRGRVVRTIDKRGGVSRYTYDGNGNALTFVNAIGAVTTNEYDYDNRLVSVTDGRGGETRFEYDALGQIVKTIDPIGRVREIEYDAAGNAIAYYASDRRLQVALTYDARSQVVEARDGFGNVTRTEYDAAGRVVKVTEPNGAWRAFERDDRDRIVSATDSTRRKIVATYDDRHGGLPDSLEIQYWDADSAQPSPTDANGEGLKLNFVYNHANDLTSVDDLQIQWEVDRSGLLSDIHNGTVVGVDFKYDSAGRMWRDVGQHQDSPYPEDERDREYLYDEAGNLVEIRASEHLEHDYRSASRRTYDELGRLTTYLDENGDAQLFTYDANDNLASITYPGAKTVSYQYDAADRLTKVTDWAGRVSTFEWNDDDLLARVDLPNGVIRRMAYDKIGQAIWREDRNAAGDSLLSCSYQYDRNGKLVSEISLPAEAPPVSQAINYSYDSDWQRMEDADGQITRDDPGNVTRAPGIGEARYNARSRMVSTDAYKYIYDQEDNLFGWQSRANPGRVTEFTVNPLGQLNKILSKRESDGNVSSETLYVYGVGLLYEVLDGEPRYFHPDVRGSTVALSDASGQVVGRVSYDPYGRISGRTGETDTMFLYNGYYGCVTSPEEIVNMRFRWYAPSLRQFLQRDPVIGDIANPASLNYFAYAGGDPISRVDPEGEFWWIAVGAIVGAVVNTVATFVEDLADDGQLNTAAERYGAAALGGAVTGAIVAGTGGVGGAFAGGAVGAATENLVYAGLTGQRVDPGALAIDTAIGGAAGAAGYGLGKAFAKVGGRVYAKHALSSNRAVSGVAKLFKPAKLARREAVGSLTELVVRSGKTSAAQIILKIVASSAGSIIGTRVFDGLSTGPGEVGEQGGGYGFFASRRALGATDVWIRNIRGGQADRDAARGIYRNYNAYLEMVGLVEQDVANAPSYNLFSF